MPLISAVYSPRLAAPTLLLIDTICSLPFALQAMPHCNWREVTPVTIAGALVLPLGVAALLYVDPLVLRWFIAALVLAALVALASGWRYHGKPTLTASLGVGALAGFGAGAVQIGAPPLLVYWLGGQNRAITVRANIMVYFIMQGALSMVMYFFSGLFSAQTIVLVVAARPAVRSCDGRRRVLVSRRQRCALSPRRLSDHRAGGAGEPAGVRCVAVNTPSPLVPAKARTQCKYRLHSFDSGFPLARE